MTATQIAAAYTAHHRKFLAIQAATHDRVGSAWDRYANVDEESAARFVGVAAPIVDAAKQSTAALAVGFFTTLDALLGKRIATKLPAAVIRNGIPTADVYQRSIVTARTALSNGRPWADAMNAGRARAVATASTDVSLTNRAAVDEVGQTREYITGWRRVLTGVSCLFCATASTQRYGSADLAPLHTYCDCDVLPIMGTSDPGRVINQARLEELKAKGPEYWDKKGFVNADDRPIDPSVPHPDEVAVHQHGEMGPVLTAAGDNFTGPDDVT